MRQLLGIAGSLRHGSLNRRLLGAAAEMAAPYAVLEVWDDLKLVPPFDEDDEDDPAAVVLALRAAIAAADGLLVVTPEYNGSLPGQLKNALDWASRPRQSTVLRDKPVTVIGASPSPGGAAAAHADGRRVLRRAGARVLDAELSVPRAFAAFDDGGHLINPEHRSALSDILRELVNASYANAAMAA
jgi:chromate reductase, NAD(P)H dehydrogenase (quinone)